MEVPYMATRLFVGSLAWATTDDSLSAFFSQVGTVTSAKVITDRATGRSKGFGFVEMSSDEEAQKAVAELNGKDLDGRAIVVNEARPMEPRDNNRGGFGGGSRGGFGGGSRGGYSRDNNRGGYGNRSY
jgi:RNA recognition motif-containing protein